MAAPERLVFVSGLGHGHGGALDGTSSEKGIMSSGNVVCRQPELCSSGGGWRVQPTAAQRSHQRFIQTERNFPH